MPLRRPARLQQLMLLYMDGNENRSTLKYEELIPVLYERHEGSWVLLSATGSIVSADGASDNDGVMSVDVLCLYLETESLVAIGQAYILVVSHSVMSRYGCCVFASKFTPS